MKSDLLFKAGLLFAVFAAAAGLLLRDWAHGLVYGQLAAAVLLLAAALVTGLRSGALSAAGINRRRSADWWLGLNVVLALLLALVLNVLAYRFNSEWDWTAERVNSLSTESRTIIGLLDQPVRLTGILSPRRREQLELRRLLELYQREAPRFISVRFLDPQQNPFEIARLGVRPGERIVLEESKGDGRILGRLGRLREEDLSNLLRRWLVGPRGIGHYLIGHGEPELFSAAPDGLKKFAEALTYHGWVMEELLLPTVADLPAESSFVIWAAPQKPVLPTDWEKVARFLDRGGRLWLLHEAIGATALIELAARYSITIGRDIIIDPQQRLQGTPLWQITASQYGSHPITAGLSGADPTVFLVTATVQAERAAQAAGRHVELVKSSAASWAETDLEQLLGDPPRAARSAAEKGGPLSLAVAAEMAAEVAAEVAPEVAAEPGRLVVFGDSQWLRNHGWDAFANSRLALQVVDWLAADPGRITVPPVSLRLRAQPLEESGLNWLKAWSLVLLELLIIAAAGLWWRRKNR